VFDEFSDNEALLGGPDVTVDLHEFTVTSNKVETSAILKCLENKVRKIFMQRDEL